MARDEPESLWNFGEPEAWRRGRNILLTIGIFHAVVQALVFVAALYGSTLEMALAFALIFLVWWLAFAFIWCGTHWVRWLLGAWVVLYGFALLIWGLRDESVVQMSSGALDLLIGAFCFAPSVHHFAVRQKEHIRWPEKLVVAGVFVLMMGSFSVGIAGVNLYRAAVQQEAKDYGERALHRIFVENDTAFLLEAATDLWKHNRYGNVGITRVLTDKYMHLGEVERTRVTGVDLRSFYQFPITMRYAGVVDGEGLAKCGTVILRLEVQRGADGWRINGVWWRCSGMERH